MRGLPDDSVLRIQADENALTCHLGAFGGDELVGTVSVVPQPCSLRPGRAWRLYGMAVTESHHRNGVGRELLTEVLNRASNEGVAILWANSRATAVEFYERCGFVSVGPRFSHPMTKLLSQVVVADVS